jgi:FkbM family methyltransferase
VTIREAAKKALHMLSPALEAKCADLWDALQPIIRRRMTLRNGTKYIVRGLCPGLGGKFTYYGTKVYFPKASFVFRMACEKTVWEPEATKWLCNSVGPQKLFIDVGANIGLMSIPVLRVVRNSRVISFEPSPNSASYLKRTWRDSGMHDRWEIITKAAGDSVGTVRFYIASPRSGAWDGLRDTGLAGERRFVEVSQTTIDAEWLRLGCPSVSCIKIDVEGAESKVLKGAEQLIRRERPQILLEWSKVNLVVHEIQPSFLLDYANSEGYQVSTFPNLQPVTGTHDLEFEMLHTEAFLLIPRDKGPTK